MQRPAARLISGGEERSLLLAEVEALLAEEQANAVEPGTTPTGPEDAAGTEAATPSDGNAEAPATDAVPENDAPLENSAAPSSTPSSTGAGR